jgi:hypothetical protein
MKYQLLLLFYIVSNGIFCQTYSNVSNQQNIQTENTTNFWGIGMSFYDFNQDGWDDLSYVTQNDTVLFYKNNNGNFTKINLGIYSPGLMKTLLWVDFDNDDDLDLFATYFDLGIRMYQNDGAFNFTDVTAQIGLSINPMQSYGASFGDYNNDGFLDLYVCNYESMTFNTGTPHTNILYFNNGDGTFSDVTIQSGTGNGYQYSFQGVWIDINKDHFLDMFVINDRIQTINALYINNGDGTFTDFAVEYGVTMPLESPMSNSFCDFDNDNDYDMFCSNFGYSQGFSQGYYLFENEADTFFVNNASNLGIQSIGAGWGSLWIDYDNDAYNDLYITTGAIFSTYQYDYTSWFYRNENGQGFTLINDSINQNTFAKSYTAVKGDINNDGFYDMAIQNEFPVNTYLFQNSTNQNNYIKLSLNASVSNSQCIGAEVKVYAGGIQQMQTQFCGEILCSQNSQYLIFGIGQNTLIDSIVTSFPSGIVNKLYDVSPNQTLQIVEVPNSNVVFSFNFPDTLVLCQNDSVVLSYPGLFTYNWSDGSTADSLIVSQNGSYYLIGNTGNGINLFSDTVHVLIETNQSFLPIIENDYCNLGQGSIQLLPTQTTFLSNAISWSNNDSLYTISNLSQGWYSYYYADSLNCNTHMDSVYVDNTMGHSTSILTNPQTDLEFGSLNAFTFGGNPPYSYTISNQQIDLPIDTLTAGIYTLYIVDALGCTDSLSFEIIDQVIGLGIGEEYATTSNVWYTEGFLFVDIKGQDLDSIQIVDNIGRIIPLGNELKDDTKRSFNIHLSTGVYHVIFHTTNGFHQQTIVVN